MKFFHVIFLSAVFLWGGAGNAPLVRAADEEEQYLSGFEDLPLMAGLEELSEGGVMFDAPQGRIVHAYARGDAVEPAAVFDFYTQTLTQMGWRPGAAEEEDASRKQFRREGEILEVRIINRKTPLVVLFTLYPQAEKAKGKE